MKEGLVFVESIERLGKACGACSRIFSEKDDKGGNYYYCEDCRSVRNGVLVFVTKAGEVFRASDEMVVEYISQRRMKSKKAA